MNIKLIMIIAFFALVAISFIFGWIQQLPKSVLNFLGVLGVIIAAGIGIMFLKHKLTQRYSYN